MKAWGGGGGFAVTILGNKRVRWLCISIEKKIQSMISNWRFLNVLSVMENQITTSVIEKAHTKTKVHMCNNFEMVCGHTEIQTHTQTDSKQAEAIFCKRYPMNMSSCLGRRITSGGDRRQTVKYYS